MRACPCCMKMLTPGILGFGGRRLTGHCEACGDAVCQACLGLHVLEAGVFRKRAGMSGQERGHVKGRVCRSCLWEVLTDRGETPPFAAPRGQRERAARAAREACAHPDVKPCMGFCPACGDEVPWEAEHGNPSCDVCGAPSHQRFNCCWACGESFDEENEPSPVARGYRLEFDCDSSECRGKLAWLMPHCPWCGEAKRWEHAEAGGLECVECESRLDRAWAFCVRCGEEAPLPDDCPRCGLGLDEASSAARCEQCHHLVCGDCCDLRAVPAESGGRHARLLCSECGAGFAPADAADDEEVEPEVEAEAEPGPREEAPPEAPPPSPWEVLGVVPGAPLAEVKRAYLDLVARYHPDKVAQLGPKLQALAQEETRRIIEAWEQVRKQARPGA